MKIKDLDTEKLRLAQKKDKLEKREQVIIQKERKLRLKQLIAYGELVVKSGLDTLEPKTLFGAFLEVKESASESLKKIWAERGLQYTQSDKANNPTPLILKFLKEPAQGTKKELRSRKFKWNPFRQEWYGYGKKEEIVEFLKSINELAQITHVEE